MKQLDIINSPSPNFDDREEGSQINVLMLHYTGMKSGQEALDRLRCKEAGVSSHYLVEEDGRIFQLVEDEKRAWHAGISCWRGRSAVNHVSIGIEIVNPGHEHGYREFSDVQMQSVTNLSQNIIEKFDIPARNVIGHSDVAPSRKEDPGELFDWKGLAWEGIGIWPEVGKIKNPAEIIVKPETESFDVAQVQKKLLEYGYHIRVDGCYGEKTEKTIKAFKRHFVPEYLNIAWDTLK